MTCARLLDPEPGKLWELSKDLICFVTSDRYLKLRRQLGVNLSA